MEENGFTTETQRHEENLRLNSAGLVSDLCVFVPLWFIRFGELDSCSFG